MNYNIIVENPIAYAEKIKEVKYECKCGHKVVIPYGVKDNCVLIVKTTFIKIKN